MRTSSCGRHRRSAWWWLFFALTAAATACELFVTDPPLPKGAIAMTPPPQYDLWWRLTERCSGLSGALGAIAWYTVPDVDSLIDSPLREWVRGEYIPAEHRIILAGHSRADAFVVRHEMLHALLNRPGHPAEYFQDRCYGVVASEPPRPARDSSGDIVRPGDLVVSARVDSTAPSLARDSLWFALTVSIHNPRAAPVRVRLRPMLPDYFASATFGFVEASCDTPRSRSGMDYYFVDDSTLVLGPGATRHMTFDERAWGCLVYRPFFNDDTLPPIRVAPVP